MHNRASASVDSSPIPLCFHFESRAALLEGLASAQEASWIEGYRIEWPHLALELRLDPAVALPSRARPWLQRMQRLAETR